MSELVGSIGIELKLEREQFDQDLRSLEVLKPRLQIQPQLNLEDLAPQMRSLDLGDRGLRITVDTTQFTALHRELDLVYRHHREVQGLLAATPLTPRTDLSGLTALDSALKQFRTQLSGPSDRAFKVTAVVNDTQLTALNKHLDLKQKHFAQVGNYFKSNSLTPKVDMSGLKGLGDELRKVERLTSRIDADMRRFERRVERLSDRTVRIRAEIDSSQLDALPTQKVARVKPITEGGAIETELATAVERGVRRGFSKNPIQQILGGLLKSATAPVRLTFDIAKSALSSTLHGVILGVTQELTKGFASGLGTALDLSLSKVGGSGAIGEAAGELLVNGILKGVKSLDTLPDVVASGFTRMPALLEGVSKQMGLSISIPTAPFKSAAAKAKMEIQNEIKTISSVAQAAGAIGREVIGEERMSQYGLTSRAEIQKKRSERTEPARNQAAREKRDALREVEDAAKSRMNSASLIQKQSEIETKKAELGEAEKKAPSPVVIQEITARFNQAKRTRRDLLIQSAPRARAADPQKFQILFNQLESIQGEIKQLERASNLADRANQELQKAELELEKALSSSASPAIVKSKTKKRDDARLIRDTAEQRRPDAAVIDAAKLRFTQADQERLNFFESSADPAQLEAIDAQINTAKKDYEQVIKNFADLKRLEQQLQAAEKDYETAIKANERFDTAQQRLSAARENLSRVEDKSPLAYRQAIKEVLGHDLPEDKRPELIVDNSKLSGEGASGLYNANTNRIYVTQEQYDRIQTNTQTPKNRTSLKHEIVHGEQLDFGSAKGLQANRANQSVTNLVKPTRAVLREYQEFLSRGYSPQELPLELDAEYRARESEKNRQVAPSGGSIQAQMTSLKAIDQAKTGFSGTDTEIAKTLQKLDRVGATASKSRQIAANIRQRNDNALKILLERSKLIDSFADLPETEALDISAEIVSASRIIQENQGLSKQLFKVVAKPEIIAEKARPKKRKPLPGATEADRKRSVDQYFDNQFQSLDEPVRQHEKTYLEGDPWLAPIAPRTAALGYLNIQAGKVAPPPTRAEIMRARARSTAQAVAGGARSGLQWLSSREYEIDTDKVRDRVAVGANIAGRVARAGMSGGQAIAGGGRSVFRQLQAAGDSSALAVVGQSGQGLLSSGVQVARALGMAARAGYTLAKGLESVVLDIIPAGRMLKGGLQQVALPAAGFAAATHLLPGGAIAAQGLQQMVGGVVSPLMQAGTGAAASGAAEFIGSAFPHAMGIAGGVTTAATGAIHAIGGAATEMVIQAGTVIVGGKALQAAGGMALSGATETAKAALPSGTAVKALPPAAMDAPFEPGFSVSERARELEPVLLEIKPEPIAKPMVMRSGENESPVLPTRKFSEAPIQPQSQRQPPSETTVGEAAAIDVAVVPSTRAPVAVSPAAARPALTPAQSNVFRAPVRAPGEILPLPNAAEAVQYTQNISAKFKEGYGLAKAAVKAGEFRKAAILLHQIEKLAEVAQQDVGLFVQALGDEAKIGSEVGNTLNSFKGVIGNYRRHAVNLKKKVARSEGGLPAELDDTHASLQRDAFVGLAGFAGSQLLHGNVGAAAGGTIATVGARVAATAIGAGREAYQGLKSDEVFKAAAALEKFRMLLDATGQKLSRQDVQQALGSELSGDLIGTLLGNAMPGVPGMAAGMVATPHLVQLREKVQARLSSPNTSAVPELNEGMARLSGETPAEKLTEKQRRVLKWAEQILGHAIQQSQNIDALSTAINGQLEQFTQKANLEESLSGLEIDKELGKIPNAPNGIHPDTYNRVKQAAEADYQQQQLRPAKDEAKARVQAATGELSQGIGAGRAAGEIDKFTGAVRKSDSPLKGMIANAKLAVTGFLGFTALSATIPMLQGLSSGAVQAAIKMDNLRTAMAFAMGGSQKGDAAIAFARDTANALGTPLEAAQKGYKNLAASTRNTAVEGQGTQDVFLGTQQAATVLGSTSDEVERAYLAMSQMASKGNVQAEELRGQLGEVIPGVMGIAARSMGTTEAELNKLLETGQIFAGDFLPKFGRQMQVEFGGASESASKNLQSSFNRLEASNQKFRESVGAAIAPGLMLSVDALNGAFAVMDKYGGMLVQTLGILGAVTLASLMPSMVMLPSAGAMAAQAFAAMAAGAGSFLVAAAPILAWTVAITAALAVAQNVWAHFVPTETGSQFEQLANSAETSMDRIAKAAAKARGEVAKVGPANNTGNNGDDLANNDWLDGTIAQYNRFNRSTNRLLGADENFGSIQTAGESQFKNDIARGKQFSESAAKLSQLEFTREVDLGGGRKQSVGVNQGDIQSALSKLQELDGEAVGLQNQRRIVASRPTVDKAELKRLDQRIAMKNAEKAQASDVVTSSQSAIESMLNGAQKRIEAINNRTDLIDDRKKELISQAGLDKQIPQLEAGKAKLDELTLSMKTSVSAGAELAKTFTAIASQIEKAAEAREKLFSEKRVGANKAELTGFQRDALNTPSMALKRAEIDSEEANQKLNELRQAQDRRRQELSGDAATAAMAAMPVGKTGQTVNLDSSLSDIEKARKGLGDRNAGNADQHNVLDQLKTYRESEKDVRGAQEGLGAAEINRTKAQESAALAGQDRASAIAEAALKHNESAQMAAVKRRQRLHVTSEADAAIEIAKVQLTANEQSEKLAQDKLARLQLARKAGLIGAEEFEKRERELTSQLADFKVSREEALAALTDANNRKAIEAMERRTRFALAAADAETSKRSLGIRGQLLTAGVKDVERKQAVQADSTTEELRATQVRTGLRQRELADVAKLKAQKVISAKDAADRVLTIEQELRGEQSKLLDLQIQQQEQAYERAVRQIEVQVDAQKRATDLLIAGLDRQKNYQNQISTQIERRKTGLDAELKLTKAIADSRISGLQARAGAAGEAADLLKQIAKDGTGGEDLGPNTQSVLRKQVGELGYQAQDPNALMTAVQNKAALEAEAEHEKIAALQKQQEIERESIRLGLEREGISARIAVIEAKRAEAEAKRNLNEAQGNLLKAQKGGDANEIANAQVGVQVARENVGLAGDGVKLAEQGVGLLGQQAQKELLANAFQQTQARNEAVSEANRNQRSRERDVAATADQLGLQGYDRVRQPMQLGAGNPYQQANQDFAAYSRNLAATQMPQAPPVNMPSQDYGAAIAIGNQNIVRKLEELSGNIIQLANSPRSLSFATKDPVSDYSQWLNQQAGSLLRS